MQRLCFSVTKLDRQLTIMYVGAADAKIEFFGQIGAKPEWDLVTLPLYLTYRRSLRLGQVDDNDDDMNDMI